jgi:very-short-patch-repair endonuclease
MAYPVVPAALKSGPFTLAEARQAGLTRKQLRSSAWRRLGGGQYAWSGLDQGPALTLAAIQRRLPAEAAFSGMTAAWLHGLDLPFGDPVEVTVPGGCGVSARAGVSVRRALLCADEVVERRGLRVTSALRTVADLGRRLPLVEAVVVADMALHKRLVDLEQLREHVAANRGRKGVVELRRVVELAEPAAESAMETRLRLVLVLAGLPRPEAQVPLYDSCGYFVARSDLYYRAQRLCVEYDGASHRDRVADDDRRQNALVNGGFRLLRFTAADVLRTPDALVHDVRLALCGPSAGNRPSG